MNKLINDVVVGLKCSNDSDMDKLGSTKTRTRTKTKNSPKAKTNCCFLCKQSNRKTVETDDTDTTDKGNSALKLWKQCLTSSLVELYSATVPIEFWTNLDQVGYCGKCFQLILEVDFFTRNIKRFQTNLQGLKRKIDKLIDQGSNSNHPTDYDYDAASPPNSNSQLGFLVEVKSEPLGTDSDELDEADAEYKYAPDDSYCEQSMITDSDTGASDAEEVEIKNVRSRKSFTVKLNQGNSHRNQKRTIEEIEDSDGNLDSSSCSSSLRKTRRACPKKFEEPDDDFDKYFENDEGAAAGADSPDTKPWRPIRVEQPCPHCSKKYTRTNRLLAHIQQEHEKSEPPFKCTKCSRGFYILDYLQKHCKRAPDHTVEDFKNMLPNLPLPKKPETPRNPKIKRQRSHSQQPVEMVTCELCGKFLRSNNLRAHMAIAHAENLSKPRCKICGKLFEDYEKLVEHEDLHKEALNQFACVICPDFPNGTKKELEFHVLQSHEENVFPCDECPRILLTEIRLRRHKAEHKIKSQSKNICEICNFTAVTPSKLKEHLLKHEERKNFVCEVEGCDAAYRTPKSLKAHKLRDHSENGERESCEICSKTFPNKMTLEKHKLYHSEERPYVCETCQVAFKNLSNLNNHRRSVHGKGNSKSKSKPRIIRRAKKLQESESETSENEDEELAQKSNINN